MKTFINVLYRRILYRIPLKFLLLLLAIFGLLFASFSSAANVDSLINYLKNETITVNGGGSYGLITNATSSSYGTYCVQFDSISNNSILYAFTNNLNNPNSKPAQYLGIYNDRPAGTTVCLYFNLANLYFYNENSSSVTIKYKLYKLTDLLSTTLPVMSSLQCQTAYSLIPVSSVDQNYCTTNNLCPSCPSCPSGGSGRSNVYINDILHVGAPNIVMNIAEEIDWDYEYTAGGNNMNIDVVGYNVDYEKIGEIIDNQNYKPSSEDFANILGILAPYTKIIVFFVFLFLVWAWIKKPFKSKKL